MPNMLTIGLSNWAIDLEGAGAVYPFQGAEWLFVLLGVIFWIGFHVLQIRQERQEVEHEMEADAGGDLARKAIDRY
jgi:hypothetical protein